MEYAERSNESRPSVRRASTMPTATMPALSQNNHHQRKQHPSQQQQHRPPLVNQQSQDSFFSTSTSTIQSAPRDVSHSTRKALKPTSSMRISSSVAPFVPMNCRTLIRGNEKSKAQVNQATAMQQSAPSFSLANVGTAIRTDLGRVKKNVSEGERIDDDLVPKAASSTCHDHHHGLQQAKKNGSSKRRSSLSEATPINNNKNKESMFHMHPSDQQRIIVSDPPVNKEDRKDDVVLPQQECDPSMRLNLASNDSFHTHHSISSSPIDFSNQENKACSNHQLSIRELAHGEQKRQSDGVEGPHHQMDREFMLTRGHEPRVLAMIKPLENEAGTKANTQTGSEPEHQSCTENSAIVAFPQLCTKQSSSKNRRSSEADVIGHKKQGRRKNGAENPTASAKPNKPTADKVKVSKDSSSGRVTKETSRNFKGQADHSNQLSFDYAKEFDKKIQNIMKNTQDVKTFIEVERMKLSKGEGSENDQTNKAALDSLDYLADVGENSPPLLGVAEMGASVFISGQRIEPEIDPPQSESVSKVDLKHLKNSKKTVSWLNGSGLQPALNNGYSSYVIENAESEGDVISLNSVSLNGLINLEPHLSSDHMESLCVFDDEVHSFLDDEVHTTDQPGEVAAGASWPAIQQETTPPSPWSLHTDDVMTDIECDVVLNDGDETSQRTAKTDDSTSTESTGTINDCSSKADPGIPSPDGLRNLNPHVSSVCSSSMESPVPVKKRVLVDVVPTTDLTGKNSVANESWRILDDAIKSMELDALCDFDRRWHQQPDGEEGTQELPSPQHGYSDSDRNQSCDSGGDSGDGERGGEFHSKVSESSMAAVQAEKVGSEVLTQTKPKPFNLFGIYMLPGTRTRSDARVVDRHGRLVEGRYSARTLRSCSAEEGSLVVVGSEDSRTKPLLPATAGDDAMEATTTAAAEQDVVPSCVSTGGEDVSQALPCEAVTTRTLDEELDRSAGSNCKSNSNTNRQDSGGGGQCSATTDQLDVSDACGALVGKSSYPTTTMYVDEIRCTMKIGGMDRAGYYTGTVLSHSGTPHGFGTMCFDDGDVYEGPFEDGEMHGPCGKYMWHVDGDQYMGGFWHNLRHGHGEQWIGERGMYIGEFSNDLKHGCGVLYNDDGGITFKGKWEHGLPIREAT